MCSRSIGFVVDKYNFVQFLYKKKKTLLIIFQLQIFSKFNLGVTPEDARAMQLGNDFIFLFHLNNIVEIKIIILVLQ